MTSTTMAARVLLRIGGVLLLLSIVCRFAGLSAANMVGADLAIAASLTLVVVAAAALRFSRR